MSKKTDIFSEYVTKSEVWTLFFFLIYFVFIMAGKAVVLGAPGWVALAAVPLGVTMVHWECMVERCPTPGGRGMAL